MSEVMAVGVGARCREMCLWGSELGGAILGSQRIPATHMPLIR